MMSIKNVLFLCTANSARSILAEAVLNRQDPARFKAYSAGSFPRGSVHPLALTVLQQHGYDTQGLRSKSWDEFAAPDAPHMDFIFTVCDNAANETCPVWLGHPVSAHWGLPDPAHVQGSATEMTQAFTDCLQRLQKRMALFAALPFATLDHHHLQQQLFEIGDVAA